MSRPCRHRLDWKKATNPFLRYREPAIIARLIAAGRLHRTPQEPVAAFAALREWKKTISADRAPVFLLMLITNKCRGTCFFIYSG
ncbi:hydroxyacylglutathione hydrolase C-terminal domain-containing protein [Undibacterium arcticum]